MPFNVFVKGINGKSYNLEDVTPEMTVTKIKQKIFDKSGIEPETQTLVFAGKPILDDDDAGLNLTVADYGIQKNCTLMLGLRFRGGLELVVKLANDEEIKIDISNTSTVKQLKEAIFAKKQTLTVDTMHLECASVELKDEKMLKDYAQLKNGSVITHGKCSLAKVPGLIIKYEDDVFLGNADGEPCAMMACGHVVA